MTEQNVADLARLRQCCQLIASLRRKGASLRAIARTFGMSKSTLHRQLPAILLLADEADEVTPVPHGTERGSAGAALRGDRGAAVPHGTGAKVPA